MNLHELSPAEGSARFPTAPDDALPDDALDAIMLREAADIQHAAGKRNASRSRAALDDPHPVGDLCDCLFRAHRCTTPAAMAKLREYQRLLTQHGNGVILAYLGAFPAVGTFGFIHFGDQQCHLSLIHELGM
mgnify:CR=1 FL=1